MSTEDPKEAFGEDFLVEDFTIKWTNTDRRAVLARWGHQPTPQPLYPSAQAADDSTLRDAALLALTTLEGWSNYDQWVWPISAMEQVRRGTTEAIAALRMALSRFAPPTEGEVAKPQKASTTELTANIQIDTSPECLQRLFDGLNAAVKPDGGYRAQTTDDPMVQTGCEQMVGVEWWLPQHGCDSLENTLDAIKGRILTAVFKWWPTATVSATQPPAEGEVAELVDRLRRASDGASAMGWEQDSWAIARAAELLQQQHPTPVPASERLPGDQLCWWYEPDEWLQGQGGWTLLRIWGGTGTYSHWLPAHALPIPQ